jgi:predicted HicB family RNase H-like nuclease
MPKEKIYDERKTIHLKLDLFLAQQLKEKARKEGKSMNAYLTQLVIDDIQKTEY